MKIVELALFIVSNFNVGLEEPIYRGAPGALETFYKVYLAGVSLYDM